MIFQDRYILTFDKEEETLKKILNSPLGLTYDLLKILFENKFKEKIEELDTIKSFVGGIGRTQSFKENYVVSSYYPYLFSFQQYFHSSYRARQGKVLEEFFKEIFKQLDNNFDVPDKLNTKQKLMGEVFEKYNSKLDLDVVVRKNKGDLLTLQLRSRDDTGGTTAKGSLVESLRKSLQLVSIRNSKLLYLIGIWDTVKSNQKNITIDKIYSNLKNDLDKFKISETVFKKNFEKGVEIREGITIKLCYGVNNIINTIREWSGNKNDKYNNKLFDNLIEKVSRFDDMWLTYCISSIELQIMKMRKHTNIIYLNKLLSSVPPYDLRKFRTHKELLDLSNKVSELIIPQWKLPLHMVSSVSDKVHYIRDLVILKFMYDLSKT